MQRILCIHYAYAKGPRPESLGPRLRMQPMHHCKECHCRGAALRCAALPSKTHTTATPVILLGADKNP
jgi:hypothetical protein